MLVILRPEVARARSWRNLRLLALTGFFFLLTEALHMNKVIFIGVATCTWLWYAGTINGTLRSPWPVHRSPSTAASDTASPPTDMDSDPFWNWTRAMRAWGFRPHRLELLATTLVSVTLAVAVISAMVYFSDRSAAIWCPGNQEVRTNFLLLFLVYLPWGILQQWLILGFGADAIDTLVHHVTLDGHPPLVRERLPHGFFYPWHAGFRSSAIVGALFGLVHIGSSFGMVAGTALFGFATAWLFLRFRALIPLGLAHGILATCFYFFWLDRDPIREIFG
jgi:hypothetical protein